MKLVYPAIFEKSDDGYTVEFPDLPGCVTQGRTLEEAMAMATDAASGWVLVAMEDGDAIPTPSKQANISGRGDNVFCNFVLLDMDKYAKQYGEKSVKKNCTIPSWLNYEAERAGVNFSAVLQNALKAELHITDR